MEKPSINNPEQIRLNLDDQYKIVASSILLDTFAVMGKEYIEKKPYSKLSGLQKIICDIAERAYINPAEIVPYLQQEKANTTTTRTNTDGSVYAEHSTILRDACMDWGMTDAGIHLTPYFEAAIGLATKDPDWVSMHEAHGMERLAAAQEDIFKYLSATMLPLANDSSEARHKLQSLRRDAEFYIRQYDPDQL